MVITSAAGAIVSVRLAVLVCLGISESCTWNVSGVLVVTAEGLPVIAPVDEFKERPAGRVPPAMDHVYGEVPPVAASAVLYAMSN